MADFVFLFLEATFIQRNGNPRADLEVFPKKKTEAWFFYTIGVGNPSVLVCRNHDHIWENERVICN